MKQFSLKGFVLVLTILLTACGGKNGQTSHAVDAAVETTVGAAQIIPQYAEGFKVKYLNDGVRLVDIADPENESAQTYHFALVPRGTKPASVPSDYQVVETPVRHVICMTTLQLSNFIALDATSYVTGITSTRHLFNEKMNEQLNHSISCSML